MLKTLLLKEYRQCFRGYFVNQKTGKLRSKWGMAGMFAFFAVLMLFLAGAFFGMSFLMGELMSAGYSWLFYAMMGTIALLLGTFGSVFNTYSMLYLAKDNELLLAMPIPPRTILTTRILLVYGLSLLYSGIVWLPALVYGWIFGTPTALSVVFGLVLLPMIALLVTVLTCALGWLVAVLASRMKNKSYLVVLLSLLFFGGYYYLCMNMSEFLMSMVTNAKAIGEGFRVWGNLLYQLGMGADGNISSMLLFCGITLGSFAVCFAVLEKSFFRIVTQNHTEEKKSGRLVVRSGGMNRALLRREWYHFISNPTYMLNCGLGILLLLVSDGVLFFKREMLMNALNGIAFLIPELRSMMPAAVVLVVSMVANMNMVSTPSVSLEGKTLWLLHALPVSGWDVLRAKLMLHLLLVLPVTLISAAAFGFCLKLEAEAVLISAVCCGALVWCAGAFGLVIGVLRPSFSWTTEVMPIKQSANVLISMLVGWLLPVAVGVAVFLLRKYATAEEVLTGASVLLLYASAWMTRWLRTSGAQIFEIL